MIGGKNGKPGQKLCSYLGERLTNQFVDLLTVTIIFFGISTVFCQKRILSGAKLTSKIRLKCMGSRNSMTIELFFSKLRALALVLAPVYLLVCVNISTAGAKPHIVLDAETGRVIFHNRAHERWAPASLTKLMTTYVTFHALRLQQITKKSPVSMSGKAIAQPPSKMGFPLGTVFTIDQALKILMVKSANDVAVALAEAVGGSEETFVALMNAHARRLGMRDTQFRNPHGLPNSEQFTTAVDFGRLTIAIQKDFPEHAGYFKVPGLRYGRRRMRNYNRLLTRFHGTIGMKTGYVCASGFNVVVSTVRKGANNKKRKLIAVVLGERSGRRRNVKAAELLHKAFKKSEDYGLFNIWNFHPEIGVDPQPTDISDEICPRKRRKRTKAARKVAKVSAISMVRREKLYMHKPIKTRAYKRIVLGGATGPNPHALRVAGGASPSKVIPVPTRRPDLTCRVLSDEELAANELPKLAVVIKPSPKRKIKRKVRSKKRRSRRKNRRSRKIVNRFPQIMNCIPLPLARPELNALVPLDGVKLADNKASSGEVPLPTKRPR